MRHPLSLNLRVLLLCALGALQSCASPTAPAPADLPLEVLKNLAYAGIEEDSGPLQLKAGRWEGTPPEPGSAAIPTLDLRGEAVARGDLDGDGNAEAVVVLDSWTGGSGVFTYLAVVSGSSGMPRNIATQFLGDRVQVREVRVEDGRVVSVLRGHGPDDPSCCPSMTIRQLWQLAGDALKEVPEGRTADPVSVKELEGGHWELDRWSTDEPAAPVPVVTLSFAAGRFSGNAGCNRYGAAARDGDSPGSLVVSPGMATRMACEEAQMAVEDRFLQILPGLQSFRFAPGMLMLAYTRPDGYGGELWFRAVAPP